MLPDAASRNSISRWPLFAALALTLAAAGLRVWHARESLWLDELHTAWCAAGTLSEVAARAAIGNQSPLFFWLQWLVIGVTGPAELALRLPSLVAGSLLPLSIFLAGRRWSGAGVGLLAATLITVDPLAIFYATEARPYALVQCLAVVHVALAAEIVATPTPRLRAMWVVLAAILFHLHYTSALLIAAELAYFLLACLLQYGMAAYQWKALALDAALVAVLFLPAIGLISGIYARRANWAAFVPQDPLTKVFDWWPWALAGWYVAAGLAIDTALGRAADRRLWHTGLLVLCWFSIPVLLAWVATKGEIARLFFPRYLVACAPAAMLLAAAAADLAQWRSCKLAVGGLVLVVALWSSGVVELLREGHPMTSRGEDWRGCIEWLNRRLLDAPYPVLVASGYLEADTLQHPHEKLLEDYCQAPVMSLYPLDADRGDIFPLSLREPGKLDQVAEMLAIHRGGAWLIVHGDELSALHVAGEIVASLEEQAAAGSSASWRIPESRSFGRVQAVLLKANSSD